MFKGLWLHSIIVILVHLGSASSNTIKMREILSVGSVFFKCMQFCNISCIYVWINIYSKIISKLLELEERCLLFSVLLSLDIIQGPPLVACSNLLVTLLWETLFCPLVPKFQLILTNYCRVMLHFVISIAGAWDWHHHYGNQFFSKMFRKMSCSFCL